MSLCDECNQRLDKEREPPRESPMVAVFGGGIAGLTAAHELSERGFSVDVFESGKVVGGLAATQDFTSTRIFTDDEKPVPVKLKGEHGFRAFYSFYRHLTDTMERIPLWDRPEDEESDEQKGHGKDKSKSRRPRGMPVSVADNLIPTYKVAVALEDNIFREIQYDRRQPRSVAAASYALGLWMVAMGFPSSDIVRLQMRLLQFMTSCRERRYHELTTKSLFDYLGKDDLSERFQKRFKNISRFLVAIDPSDGDALTQAMIMCRLLMDPVVAGESQKNVDRVLNGPTSERWIDPWFFFLKRQNVRFFFQQQLKTFAVDRGKVVGARLECLRDGCDNGQGYALNQGRNAPGYSYFVSAVAGDALAEVLSESDGLLDADAVETAAKLRKDEAERRKTRAAYVKKQSEEAADDETRNAIRKESADLRRKAWLKGVRADATIVTGDPDLRSWVTLVSESGSIAEEQAAKKAKNDKKTKKAKARDRANYRPWMSGIQFYLSDNLTVLPGHIHFPDSKWALTAVCQSQFWGGDFFWRYGKGKVRSILSVDICEFEAPGEFVKGAGNRMKTALECTETEIATEVWHQMKEGLKAWDMVLPEIFDTETFDPNNKRARDKAIREQRPQQLVLAGDAAKRGKLPARVPLPYLDHHIDQRIYFHRKTRKIVPELTRIQYFVPGVKSWHKRPGPLPPLESWDQGYRVRLGSLVIVGSFAQTFTSINTMEAANESARHGVNALLADYEDSFGNKRAREGSPYVRYERCTIWPLEADEPASLDFWQDVDRNLFWDEKNKKAKDDPRHLFEIIGLDSWLAALLPNPDEIDNASFNDDKLWDSDGWKRFEKGFGGLWDKLLTLGRFSSPYS